MSTNHTGSLLGKIFYKDENYGALLLSRGLAYTIQNPFHSNYCEDDELLLQEQEAKENRVGIWAKEKPVFEENFFRKKDAWQRDIIYDVKISSIVNESCIYIHLMENNKDLSFIDEEIKEIVLTQSLEILKPTMIFPGMFCLARFSEDLKWYRARVTSVNATNESYNVFFIDYGNSESVKSKSLAVMPASLLEIEPQAIRVSFVAVTLPKNYHEMHEEALDFLQESSSDIKLQMEFYDDLHSHILVDLRLFGGQSLIYMLLSNGYARIKKKSFKKYISNPTWETAEKNAKIDEIGIWMCDDRLSHMSNEDFIDQRFENIDFTVPGGEKW